MNSTGVRRYTAAFVSGLWLAAAGACAAADCTPGPTTEQRVARFKAADQEAESSMHARQFGQAVTRYKEAVCLVPDSARGWYGLGMAEAAAGSFREARDSLNKADQL